MPPRFGREVNISTRNGQGCELVEIYKNGGRVFLSSFLPLSPSSPLGCDNQGEMDRRQSPRVSSGSSGQRVTDDGAVHGSPPAFPQVQPTSEDLRCRPMPNQPTTNYPAGHPPAAGIPYDSLHWAVQGEYVSHPTGGFIFMLTD